MIELTNKENDLYTQKCDIWVKEIEDSRNNGKLVHVHRSEK